MTTMIRCCLREATILSTLKWFLLQCLDFVLQTLSHGSRWGKIAGKSCVVLSNEQFLTLLIGDMTTAVLSSNLVARHLARLRSAAAIRDDLRMWQSYTPMTWSEPKSLEQWMRGSENRVRCSSKQEAPRSWVGVMRAGPEASVKISTCHQWGRWKDPSRYHSFSFDSWPTSTRTRQMFSFINIMTLTCNRDCTDFSAMTCFHFIFWSSRLLVSDTWSAQSV